MPDAVALVLFGVATFAIGFIAGVAVVGVIAHVTGD